MNCDVGKATEGLEKAVIWVKRRKGWRMSCEVAEVTERFENELSSQFILQPFFRFSYVTGCSLNVTWRAAHGVRFSFDFPLYL